MKYSYMYTRMIFATVLSPAIKIFAFELIRPENYSALCKSGLKQMRPLLINAASDKNDVYLWIYMIHTIKRHIVMI